LHLDDSLDDSRAHHIRSLVVDNTGGEVGAAVRHSGTRWSGTVELKFDVTGGPRAEYVAVIPRGGHVTEFRTGEGTVWECPDRVAESVTGSRNSKLVAPRKCLAGASTLTVRAVAKAAGEARIDTAVSRIVAQQSRPNIVMVMLDDMRADDLAYMPLTQRLIGDQGVTFANSLAPYPLCCPARASVLTGQYAHNHRVWSHLSPWGFTSFDDDSTLATWLQDAGYATTYIGKYLNGYGNQPEPGQETGKSTTYVPPGWTDWRASMDGLASDHPQDGGTYRYLDTTLNDNGVEFDNYAGQYQSRVYGQLSKEVVTTRAASDQPFFFYLSFTAPHHGGPTDPDDPAPVTNNTGSEQDFPTPYIPEAVRGSLDDVVHQAPGADWYRALAPQDKPEYLRGIPPMNDAEKAAMLEVTRQRAESISVVDQEVARMIRALDRTGELEETLIMLTSDNGYFLGEQGIRAGKTLPHEPSIHTPLVMRGPGIPAGETRYDPFLSIDFAPTIAELARVQPEHPVDGVSMLSVARHGDRGWTRAVLTETGKRNIVRATDEAGEPLTTDDPGAADIRYAIGVRSDRYLYIHLATGEEELYDMAVDPDQYDNLANQGAYARIRDLMREQLRVIRACDAAQCRAQLPPELASAPGESILNIG
jgi:arylsulfatase A-like enzyme